MKLMCIVTVLSLLVVSDAMIPKLPKFLENLVIKLCNRPEIIEKICPDQDPCDGVTCSDNGECVDETGMCNCDADFTGENCEFCMNFVPRLERFFSLDQFEVTGPDTSDAAECTAECTPDIMCSTSAIVNNNCRYYSDSVIAVLVDTEFTACQDACIFTQNCLAVAVTDIDPCLLLRIPDDSIDKGTGGSDVFLAFENCSA